MTQGASKRGCLRTTCIGCLAVIGAGMVVVAVLAVLAWISASREVRIEPVDISRAVPSPEEIPPPAAPDTGLRSRPPPAGGHGRVVLDLSWGSFTVRAGAPGEPLRLDGSYDSAGFELEESYEEDGAGGWIYRVGLSSRGFRMFFDDNETQNRLRLTLPPDVPLDLAGKIGIGESSLDLEGLRLGSVDLDIGTGSHTIDFAAPSAVPLERFRVKGSIGELYVKSLGNASPATVEVSHRIGEVGIDLRGAWQRDADVSVRCGIGECGVRVPRDAKVELLDSGVLIGESTLPGLRDIDPPENAPTLRLSLGGTIGEVTVQ